MFSTTRSDGYTISTDPDRLDLDLVHTWLCTDAYWALGRDRETVVRAFAGSIGFGVYHPVDGRQVAVARVITDRATFAYLCDVYVDRAERGHGLGTWLAGAVRDHLGGLGVRRILLATNDAHGVYEKIGFSPVRADRWMEFDRRYLAVSPLTSKDQPVDPPLTVEA
ncbi:Acetyltransferase (GNAT) family protein [Micromonospora phaseoli]|uniref:Acetyltransferase (GNAT) family protein n=1 Tax=Micromonospora phaseoli TaxID=1144548 RepID=A0A1H7APC4_9ACTN|nr:GNAT family N-acetyltransferase [Micromonospora phaseoli]PZV96281.1 acetyltransferase (GNAT) family protein [Micromonospora phaseoli]GIJ75956.1 N-acetyltransferase [Micromonospora phaseoli]SEJ66806.1 Acetyltransferase (GNAT) family protein [Micromonospora phaseoli]